MRGMVVGEGGRSSGVLLYTCRVFITVNYMQPNLRATEVPGCCRVTCLLLAVIGISTQGLILEFADIVNGNIVQDYRHNVTISIFAARAR